MGLLSKRTDPDNVDTLIGKSTVFEGKLSATGGIKVEGTVRGTIECEGVVVVGVGGRIEADINAATAIIGGGGDREHYCARSTGNYLEREGSR